MQIARAAVLAIAILALLGPNAHAQTAAWNPTGNVEFFVGAGAGGENDRIARAIQRVLTKEHLVNSMTVLNKPGAAQIIAMTDLSRKEGDGNEIGLASGSFINAIARKGLDLHKHLTPLVKLFDAYQCYFTGVDSPIKSMVDVRDRLKADPGSVTFAFPVGLGSPLHVSVVNVGKTAGAPANKLVTVVFDSGSDVSVQAAGGHIDVGETSIGCFDAADPGRQAAHARHCFAGAAAGRIGQISDAARAGPRRGDGEFLHRAAAEWAKARADRVLGRRARPRHGRPRLQARSGA